MTRRERERLRRALEDIEGSGAWTPRLQRAMDALRELIGGKR